MVRLPRSDSTGDTTTFKPDTIGIGVTPQGTAKTDSFEVTTYFSTSEHYKIFDQIYEFKKRGRRSDFFIPNNHG